MIFGLFKKKASEYDRARAEQEAAEIARINEQIRAAQAEKPIVSPPRDGNIGVGIKQTTDAVYVWIELTQADKDRLASSGVLDTQIDERLDREAIEKEVSIFSEIIDETDAEIARLSKGAYDISDDKAEQLRAFREELEAKNRILVRDLLANPYRHQVKNRAEAITYTERLKSKVLPALKTVVEQHSRPASEAFQL
jgi:hypothetical protein